MFDVSSNILFPSVFSLPTNAKEPRTHLINRKRARCQRFGGAARREEGEYPLWTPPLPGRRATQQQRQRSATRRAVFWRAPGGVAPQSQSFGYAPSSRLASRPPENSAPISYL